jgi:DNA polymerase III epsilon subunit-like protein
MRITVFDTETTGFPVREGRLDQQPYIVQFASITGEIDASGVYHEISRENITMKPPVSIPFGASQVHGIYDRDVEDKLPIREHMDLILKVLHDSDIVAWHNVEFDEQILSFELERLGRKGEYSPTKTLCTMRTSTDYCKLQWRGFSYKPPKLAELHKFLFGEFFEGAHDAMMDVEATMRSLIELINRKVIVLETNNVMRLF